MHYNRPSLPESDDDDDDDDGLVQVEYFEPPDGAIDDDSPSRTLKFNSCNSHRLFAVSLFI